MVIIANVENAEWQDHLDPAEQTVPEKDIPAIPVPWTVCLSTYPSLGEMHRVIA